MRDNDDRRFFTEHDALAAAEAAGWTIVHDQYGTRCTYNRLSNRLVDAGAQGWYWLVDTANEDGAQ